MPLSTIHNSPSPESASTAFTVSSSTARCHLSATSLPVVRPDIRARVVIISPGCLTLLPVMREISRATSDFALQVFPYIAITLVAMVVRSPADQFIPSQEDGKFDGVSASTRSFAPEVVSAGTQLPPRALARVG